MNEDFIGSIKRLNYDVTVVGGGAAGAACAYVASKNGLRVLLVEKNNYLGGLMTGGLVVPVMKSDSQNINTEFYCDLLKYAKDFGAQATYSDGNDGWFNPVLLKTVLEKMLKDAGVDILYEAQLAGYHADCTPACNPQGSSEVQKKFVQKESGQKKLEFLEFKLRTLSVHIYSKYFVDTTGEADLCEFLNCDFIDDFGKNQPATLRFLVSGINLEKFSKQILEIDKNRDVTSACKTGNDVHLSTAYTFDSNKNWGLAEIFNKAVDEGDLKYQDTAYFQVFSVAGMPDTLAFNCPRLHENAENDDYSAVLSHSNALIEARAAIFRIHNFMKKYFDGFEKSFIAQIADMTGYRVSKRPKTKYIYKLSDITEGKTFENPVLCADYPVDIHSNKENSSTLKIVKKYYLPLECLISANYGNLFVAGRNLGAEFEAQAALRIQKSCFSMGEALAKHFVHLERKI